jgi:hypothetical protein
VWSGKGNSRRRRALSPGAIRNLRTLVSSNALYNDSLGSNGEASIEVNHAEHTEVDRFDVVNVFSEENNADNDQPRDNGTGLFVSDN